MKRAKKTHKIILISLLILLIAFLIPLRWMGISDMAFRFLFDSNINQRLAANQSWLPENLDALAEDAQHIIRAEIISVFENEWLFIGDTFQPYSMQIAYEIRVVEVYQSNDQGHGTVSAGDYLEFHQFIPLHGSSLAGRLLPSANQVRLPIAVGDDLVLFLEHQAGMGRRMYRPINTVSAVYYFSDNRAFTSMNRHNNLYFTREHLLNLSE